MIEYKGSIGRCECDEEAAIVCGEVINTRDVITFQGASVAEVKKAFHESVDDYLAFCKARGEAPDKPLSGQSAGPKSLSSWGRSHAHPHPRSPW